MSPYASHEPCVQVCQVGQKRGYPEAACTYPNEHVGAFAYSHASNSGMTSHWGEGR